MESAQNKIKEIVDGLTCHMKTLTDVDGIIGKPYVTMDGCTILPVSQVTFGFAAGGGEYGGKKPGFISGGTLNNFAGVSGGGATITPVAFLIVTGDSVKLVSADGNNTYADKIADMAKDIFIGLNRG